MSDLDWTAPAGAVFTYGELWELRAFALQAEADKISEGSFARKALDRLNFVLDGAASTQPPSPRAEVQDCERCKGGGVELRQGCGEWISDVCPNCNGTGKQPPAEPQDIHTCFQCGRTGKRNFIQLETDGRTFWACESSRACQRRLRATGSPGLTQARAHRRTI
jgi:hypothetical protein